MWTEGSVITVSSFSRTPSGHFPLLRKTHFCCFCQLLVDFPSLCSAYATSLRIPWALAVQEAQKAGTIKSRAVLSVAFPSSHNSVTQIQNYQVQSSEASSV